MRQLGETLIATGKGSGVDHGAGSLPVGVSRAGGRVVKEGRPLTVYGVDVSGADDHTLCATTLVTARNTLPGR